MRAQGCPEVEAAPANAVSPLRVDDVVVVVVDGLCTLEEDVATIWSLMQM
jgi:hypothetical protein